MLGQGVQATAEIDAFERGVRPVLRIVLPEKAEAVLRFRAGASGADRRTGGQINRGATHPGGAGGVRWLGAGEQVHRHPPAASTAIDWRHLVGIRGNSTGKTTDGLY